MHSLVFFGGHQLTVTLADQGGADAGGGLGKKGGPFLGVANGLSEWFLVQLAQRHVTVSMEVACLNSSPYQARIPTLGKSLLVNVKLLLL